MNTLWDSIATSLLDSNYTTFFGMVGDGIGLLESVSKSSKAHVYTARDQRIAVAMAVGWSQSKRDLGIYVASPGPGLANASMAILEAYSQCIPLLIFSNGTSRVKKSTKAFQEFDSINFMKMITKYTVRIESLDHCGGQIQKAIMMATCGKPGPVYIEIPDDIIMEGGRLKNSHFPQNIPSLPRASLDSLEVLVRFINSSDRLVIIAGGGSLSAKEILSTFVEKTNACAFVTASGRGVMPEDHSCYTGLIGLYMTPPAEVLFRECDSVIVLGSQLEETALMGLESILREKPIFHINLTEDAFSPLLPQQKLILGDVTQTINQVLPLLSKKVNNEDWLSLIKEVKESQNQFLLQESSIPTVRGLLQSIQQHISFPADWVVDNGMHDMWAYFYPVLTLKSDDRFFSPGEHTGLGLPLGVALGVNQANPKRLVIVFVGDGSMSLGRSALLTALENNQSFLIVMLNNKGFSWPKIAQRDQKVSVGCYFQIEDDYAHLIESNGGYYQRINSLESIEKVLASVTDHLSKSKLCFLELIIQDEKDIPIGIVNNFMS